MYKDLRIKGKKLRLTENRLYVFDSNERRPASLLSIFRNKFWLFGRSEEKQSSRPLERLQKYDTARETLSILDFREWKEEDDEAKTKEFERERERE